MRRREPRITDPASHPKRYVSLVVAAEYLEMDRKTLNKVIDAGLLAYREDGCRRKIAVTELLAYEQRQRRVRRAG